MVSGDTVGSRWGLKGSEDLGGGMKAIFQLENGFNTNNGATGSRWPAVRPSGLRWASSAQYGTSPWAASTTRPSTCGVATRLPAITEGDSARIPYDNDNADWDYRIQNSVKYAPPTHDGLHRRGHVRLQQRAGGLPNNRMYSAALQYQTGGLSAAVAYLKMNNAGSANGAVSTDTVFTASSQQDIEAGIAYQFASTRVAFAYSHVDVYDPTALDYFTTAATQPPGGNWTSWKFDNFEINGKYSFTPSLYLVGAYTFTMAHLDSTVGNFMPKWHQVSAMLGYDLSKRTTVYVQGSWQHVVSANTGTDFDYAQTPASTGISSGENQMVYRVAMIHRF